MSIAEKLRKHIQKVKDEGPAALIVEFIAAGVLGVGALMWAWGSEYVYATWNWLKWEVMPWRITLVTFFLALIVLGFFLVSTVKKLRAVTAHIEAVERKQSKSAPTATAEDASADYKPRVILDEALGIEWLILAHNDDWLMQVGLLDNDESYWRHFLSGPFHSKCKAELLYEYNHGVGGQVIKPGCPVCRSPIFKLSSEVRSRAGNVAQILLMSEAIKELQRLQRNDVNLVSGAKLEKPRYWDWLVPVKA